jgi:hypothetical protein
MMYAKLIDGKLCYAPSVMRRDGMTIVGYDKDPTAMLADGYLPVRVEAQSTSHGDFVPCDKGIEIAIEWKSKEPPPSPEPPPYVDPLDAYSGLVAELDALWASLNVGALPSDWSTAMALLDKIDVGIKVKLLAYRVALAPVWNYIIARTTANGDSK